MSNDLFVRQIYNKGVCKGIDPGHHVDIFDVYKGG